MFRCLSLSWLVALALSLPLSLTAQNLVQRSFPPDALRGKLQVVQPPVVALNEREARLAPGARIRGGNNLLVMSGALVGQELTVHYTADSYGLIKDVWILRPDEARRPWPATREEAARWAYDPVANAWAER